MKPKIKIAVAVAGFVGAAVVHYLGANGGWPLSFDPEPHRASGVIIAQETLKLLRPGGKLYVVARDTSNFGCPAAVFQLEAFQGAIAAAHASIDSFESIPVDPLRPLQAPSGDLYDLMRTAPQGSVIVSFMGPPILSEEQWNKIGELKAANVAFCPGSVPAQSDLRALVERQRVSLGVIDRTPRPDANTARGSERAIFDHFFATVTPANTGALPKPGEPTAP